MIVHPHFYFECDLASGGKKARMKWGWLKKLGGWLIRYAPGLVEVIMTEKAKEAAKKPPTQ